MSALLSTAVLCSMYYSRTPPPLSLSLQQLFILAGVLYQVRLRPHAALLPCDGTKDLVPSTTACCSCCSARCCNSNRDTRRLPRPHHNGKPQRQRTAHPRTRRRRRWHLHVFWPLHQRSWEAGSHHNQSARCSGAAPLVVVVVNRRRGGRRRRNAVRGLGWRPAQGCALDAVYGCFGGGVGCDGARGCFSFSDRRGGAACCWWCECCEVAGCLRSRWARFRQGDAVPTAGEGVRVSGRIG